MKTIIIYGSSTGNNEQIASLINSKLKLAGKECILKNVINCNVTELIDYDCILIGSSTWGDGDLQDDMIGFIGSLKTIDLKSKKFAAFGVGEDVWPHFCTAPDLLEQAMKESGAECINECLKVNGPADENKDLIVFWTNTIASKI